MGLLSSSPHPGERLRSLRKSVGLTIREVERRSLEIAESKGNPDYLISHSWLQTIERDGNAPSMFKMYSLSAIYDRGCAEIHSFFGVQFADLSKDRALFGWPATHVVGASEDTEEEKISFPVGARSEFLPESTSLLSRLVQVWGDVPVALLRQLDLRKSMYGYIGQKDFTLYPVVLPGSFVQIDPAQTKIKPGISRREMDRPIYFVELRESYACGWCELRDGQLSIVPHINSPQAIRRFAHPQEAEIIGRVTGVAMRIVNGGFSAMTGLPGTASGTP
jgi:transcriptional regulator with XRE-family HTH domain